MTPTHALILAALLVAARGPAASAGPAAPAARGQGGGGGGLTSALKDALASGAPSSDIIIIASAQRSGSTELCESLACHPCVESLNEFFSNGWRHELDDGNTTASNKRPQSERAREYLGDAFAARQANALRSLQAARAGACERMDALHAARGAPLCGARCAVVLKLFAQHTTHMPPAELSRLLLHGNATVVVLDRDADDSWCSRTHALANQDWGHHPSSQHAVNHSTCTAKAPALFRAKRQRWLSLVRAAAVHEAARGGGGGGGGGGNGTRRRQPAPLRIEVPFEVWTDPTRSMAVLDSIWGAAGLAAFVAPVDARRRR